MTFGHELETTQRRWFAAIALVFCLLVLESGAALPKRLVIAVDGVPFRDMQALQRGMAFQLGREKMVFAQTFHRGYFPVSRVISTYPSASDVAWTDVFHGSPLPGYQRTYYSLEANHKVVQNGVTTTMEYEHEMDWQEHGGFHRAMGYVHPQQAFKRELKMLAKNFLAATNHPDDTFYVLMRSTDDAQHLSGDIIKLMLSLDAKLEELRAEYRRREGRELELVVLSDHGNNHAGAPKRVEVMKFLQRAGYHVGDTISSVKDVVLPTAGIETWVEMHNHPQATERLVELLSHMEGVDVVTGLLEAEPPKALVMNSKGKRAEVCAAPGGETFSYAPIAGDPLQYGPALKILQARGVTNAFASSQAWLEVTGDHYYPAAPERIIHGHTKAVQNPATIIISLNNKYAHSDYWIKKGSEFVKFGGTHGGMDALNCVGMLVSTVAPGKDALTRHAGDAFQGFPSRRDYRSLDPGAEWVRETPRGAVGLRVWSPELAALSADCTVEGETRQARMFAPWTPFPAKPQEAADQDPHMRVFWLPRDFALLPRTEYRARVKAAGRGKHVWWKFAFWTDANGLPAGCRLLKRSSL